MKKIVAALLLVCALGFFPGNAYAAEYAEEDWDYNEEVFDIDLPDVGLTLYFPYDLFENAGHIELMYGQELSYGSGAYYTEIGYFAMSDDEFYALEQFDSSRYAPLVAFVCMRNGCDLSAFKNAGIDVYWENAWRLATVDNYTHYMIAGGEGDALPSGFREPYASEYFEVIQSCIDLGITAEYSVPVNPYTEQAGRKISFDTTDLNGNPVSSEALFSPNEVTMINIWATWCGYCVNELPDLARIHNELQPMGCGIVGILTDGQDPEDLADARQYVQNAGVTYPVINMPTDGDEIFDLQALPITYFVDRSGALVGVPIEGAQVNAYAQAVRDILAGNIPG